MPNVVKRNAIIVLALAVLFCWAFMYAKHDPALRNIIPFGEDPYDAVGSYGVIVGMLIALLSVFRAFRPYSQVPSFAQRVYVARAQEAVGITIGLTLAADAVAMARHPSMWAGAPGEVKLIGLLALLTITTACVQMHLRAAQQNAVGSGKIRWRIPVSVTLLALLLLACYPEQLINHIPAHLFTIVAGAVALFAPLRFLLNALVPYASNNTREEDRAAPSGLPAAGQEWAVALLVGAMVGGLAFLGEIAENGGAFPWGRLILVASVYVGLGIAGLVIAYALLGSSLGLRSRS